MQPSEELLAKVIVGMTISLDGFVADQNGNAGRLYPDLAAQTHRLHEGRYRADWCSPHGEKDVRDGGPRLVRRQLRIPSADFRADPSPAERCTETRRAPDLHVRNRRCGISSRPSKSCRPR